MKYLDLIGEFSSRIIDKEKPDISVLIEQLKRRYRIDTVKKENL